MHASHPGEIGRTPSMAYLAQPLNDGKLKVWSRWKSPVMTKPRNAVSRLIADLNRLNS